MSGKLSARTASAGPMLRTAGFGCLFWAGLLLALDPDLIFGTAQGWLPAVEYDARRIASASALGGAMAMVQLLLVKRFPAAGEGWLRNLAVHIGACVALAFGAIVIANAGVALVVPTDSPRLQVSLAEEIEGNLLLLSFGLGVFSVLLHMRRRSAGAAQPVMPRHAGRISVPTRNGVLLVEAESIDWIEAQGNYAALHVGTETHLVRETLTRLAERLDPEAFVRIHRGQIVNLLRVERVRPLGSGDAFVTLRDGTELRASRTFASVLRERVRPSAYL